MLKETENKINKSQSKTALLKSWLRQRKLQSQPDRKSKSITMLLSASHFLSGAAKSQSWLRSTGVPRGWDRCCNDFVSCVSREEMQQRATTIYWEWEKEGKGHHH